MKPFLFLIAAYLMLVVQAFGRLGDTREQAEQRYGVEQTIPPGTVPLIENSHELLFVVQGWNIRCAMLQATDGKEYIVREAYSKVWNADVMKAGGTPTIRDFERDAILKGEGEGHAWHNQVIANAGPTVLQTLSNQLALSTGLTGTSWIRDDGALAHLPFGSFTMVLELPQVLKYEAQLKAIKEQKARAAVPQF